MAEITLREINRTNWLECIGLEISPEQARFVAPNVVSLLQAQFNPLWVPLAIYCRDIMVGFIMYGKKERDDGVYWILRMVIDERYQRKGYGLAALQAVLRLLREKPDCREIKVSFQKENVAVERLCMKLGFEDAGTTTPLLFSILSGILTGRPWTIC
jgi:diamine N-acetyltransferase